MAGRYAFVVLVLVCGIRGPAAAQADPKSDPGFSLVAAAVEKAQKAMGAVVEGLVQRHLQELAPIRSHLARLEGSLTPRPAGPDPSRGAYAEWGPFVVGQSYLIQRAGWNTVETIKVELILPNGWLKVVFKPVPDASIIAQKERVFLNPAQIIMVAPES